MKYIEKWKEIDVTELPKEDGYCLWQEEDNDCFSTQCHMRHSDYISVEFEFCPYCGKKIKKLVEITMFIKKEDYPKAPKMIEKYILNGVQTTREVQTGFIVADKEEVKE